LTFPLLKTVITLFSFPPQLLQKFKHASVIEQPEVSSRRLFKIFFQRNYGFASKLNLIFMGFLTIIIII